MTTWVKRDGGGAIMATSTWAVPGSVEMADDHPDVVAFLNPPPNVSDYQQAVEAHIDATARSRGYSSGVSCASYIGSTSAAWAAEAMAFVAWRDNVWVATLATLAAWQGGGNAPTIAGLIAELPPIVWPA